MSTEENKKIILHFYTEMDTQHWETVRRLLAPDAVIHVPGAPGPLDPDGFLHFGDLFYAAFPDGRHTFEEVVAEGNAVVTRGVFRGTHRGELQGMPATGKQVALSVTHVDHLINGIIAEHWGEGNMMSLMQQLGAVPMPGSG